MIFFSFILFLFNEETPKQENWKKTEILQNEAGVKSNKDSLSNLIIIVYIFILFIFVSWAFLKRKEKKLNEKVQKEEIKNKFLEERIAQVTHYLITPLQSITLSLDEILYLSKDKKVKSELSSTLNELENLSNKINRNLQLFKSDSNLNNIIKNSILSIQKAFKRNCITIKYKEIVDYKYSRDINNLEMVISILLENTIKALSDVDNKIVNIEVIDSDSNYIIYVKDNGKGIELKNINKIFEKGFTTKEEENGGLGLYFAKDIIVNDLNGKIKVYNDNGATFEIMLPKSYFFNN